MKTYWRSGGIAPHILKPRCKMEVSGQLYAPPYLLPVSIGQEAEWAPGRVCTWWRKEKYHFITPAENRIPVIQPVAQSLLLWNEGWRFLVRTGYGCLPLLTSPKPIQ